jgi:hypothetical protein
LHFTCAPQSARALRERYFSGGKAA